MFVCVQEKYATVKVILEMEDKSTAQKPGPEKGNARIDFKPESQSTDTQGISGSRYRIWTRKKKNMQQH